MEKISLLIGLLTLCSALESKAVLFKLTEQNGEISCCVPEANAVLNNSFEDGDEITVVKDHLEFDKFKSTIQHLEVLQADDVNLQRINSLVTANIVAKRLTMRTLSNLRKLTIDGLEYLNLKELHSLTGFLHKPPKKTSIECCNALLQLDVTGCEDLYLSNLPSLIKVSGLLAKKTVITNCNVLPELGDAAGCDDLYLSNLPGLIEMKQPLAKKTVITNCNALPELYVNGCEDLCLYKLPSLIRVFGFLAKKNAYN